MEGYPDRIYQTIQRVMGKQYDAINPQDGKPTKYRPAFREIRLFNVTMMKEIHDQVLTDLGYYAQVSGKDTPWNKKWKKMRTYINTFLKFISPLGFKAVNTKDELRGKLGMELPAYVYVIAEKEDRLNDDGLEMI